MNLPEQGRVELRRQLTERRADQKFTGGGAQYRVFNVGVEVPHIVHRDVHGHIADASA